MVLEYFGENVADEACDRCGDPLSEHHGERGPCKTCEAALTYPRCMEFRHAKVSVGLQRSGRINPVSDHRRDVNVVRKANQLAAWGPRPWKCRLPEYVDRHFIATFERIDAGRCFGEVNGHEVTSRRQDPSDENLTDVSGQVPLCNHHNEWCDLNQAQAKRLGLHKTREII